VTSPRLLVLTRWFIAAAGLAAIVAVYRLWLHVNPTTVALTLLLLILSLGGLVRSRRLRCSHALLQLLLYAAAGLVDNFRSAELDRAVLVFL
jgi:uncharacterized membrane protein